MLLSLLDGLLRARGYTTTFLPEQKNFRWLLLFGDFCVGSMKAYYP